MLACLHPGFAHACRFQAMMGPRDASPKIQQEEARFFRASLLDSENALLKESRKRPYKTGIGEETYDIEDLSNLIRRVGSPDGWGMVSYSCPMQATRLPEIDRSDKPAFSDTQFAPAVEKLTRSHPNLFLAHVRQTDDPRSVAMQNVHPFTYQNWSLMHNGGVSGAFAPAVMAKIDAARDRLDGGPKGQTDSERVLYYFLALLLERTGTTDSSKIPVETMSDVFRETLATVIAASPGKSKPLNGEIMGIQGQLETLPSCNFVLSDGQRLFAFRRVLNLYLGRKILSDGLNLYIISSERSVKADKTLQWLLLPENHLLMLSWNQQGQPVPVLTPLSLPGEKH